MLDYISCQGFAGGFDCGMTQAGFRLVHKVEHKGGFGTPQCEANRHILGYDWEAQACDAEQWEVMPAHVVVGNPPCS